MRKVMQMFIEFLILVKSVNASVSNLIESMKISSQSKFKSSILIQYRIILGIKRYCGFNDGFQFPAVSRSFHR